MIIFGENIKLTRTYIGGSKRTELDIFMRVQGVKEDNSDCDWTEYGRIFRTYCQDRIHVLESRSNVTLLVSFIPLLIAYTLSLYRIGTLTSIIILVVGSILFLILHFIIKLTLIGLIRAYQFGISVINENLNK